MTQDEAGRAGALANQISNLCQRFFGAKDQAPMTLEEAQIISLACRMLEQTLRDTFAERGH